MSTNSAVWGLVEPSQSDAANITTAFTNFVGSLEGSTTRMPMISKGIAASVPAFGTWGRMYLTTDTNVLGVDNGSGWTYIGGKKTIRFSHAFNLGPSVLSGDTAAGFSVALATGQTSNLVKVRYWTLGGTATFSVNRNGSGATGFTALAATTTDTQVTPTAIALSENDKLTISVTAASSCTGLGVTVVTEEVV